MAFIGTPLDTTNTFQSLVGKRFSGDGSTTDFTLDVAPGNVLDIEVFVGNVRQDPNSAYTVSGTTLSFTGAPPSGTNNVYVVHQAKSVGTIDVPTGGVAAGSLASSVLTGQTDIGGAIADTDLFLIDDGAGGTLRKTAASRIKTYAGYETDAAQTFNESGADVDFRVEGDTNTHLLFIDASNDSVNINASTTGAKFLVGVADNAGTTAPSSYGSKNMVIGKQSEGIHFAWDDTNNKGYIGSLEPGVEWRHLTLNSDGGTVSIGTNAVAGSFRHEIRFSGNPGYGMILSNSANVASTEYISFRCASTQEIGSIKRDGGGDAIAFNTSSDYRLKQDIVDIDDGITRLKTLQPKRFKWKSDTSRLVDGFIAHEVTAVPESITGTKDETENKLNVVIDNAGSIIDENKTEQEWTVGKAEGKYPSNSTWSASKSVPKYQQIDQAKLVPLLTAALQEAVTKIEALEARIKALEEA